MSRFRDLLIPWPTFGGSRGRRPLPIAPRLQSRAPCIAEGVFDARNNGECQVETAVSLILGYEGAVSHFAASITKGVFDGNICYQKTIDSQTAAMDEGVLGQMAQEPHSFEIFDHSWTFNCLGGPTVQS